MTRTEIESMKSGREMDRLLAAAMLVMPVQEWRAVADDGGHRVPDRNTKEAAEKSATAIGGRAVLMDFFKEYSECNITAMETLDEHWTGDYEIRRQNGQFRATLYQPSREWEMWGETLPLAISRAMLSALSCLAAAGERKQG